MRDVSRKVSVLMPAYNEVDTIVSNIEETCRVMRGSGRPFEVIVIDDGSSDRTWPELRKVARRNPQVRIKRHLENHGKGRALKFGCRFATGGLVAFLDADLELHPRQLLRFLDILERTGVDVVIGSKWHPDSSLNYPVMRGVISRIYYTVVKILFGLPVRDTQTGLKLFRAEVLRRIFPVVLVKKYAFDLEILVNVRRLGYRIVEAPVEVLFRRQAMGRIRLRDLFYTWVDTMAIFYRLHLLRYYDRKAPR